MRSLISPVITEKSIAKVVDGKYIFRIRQNANKPQIAKAISEFYKVNVVKVNIINNQNEEIIVRGRHKATKKGYKKAIVTIKKGQKIPGFEEK